MHPILLLVALIVVFLAFSWFTRLPLQRRQKVRKQGLLIGIGGILLFLLVTGRLHPLFAVLAALLPFASRAMGLLQAFSAFRSIRHRLSGQQQPTSGKTSEVRTRYLRMALDHDSGSMDAEVLTGQFAKRTLSSMNLTELHTLLAECRVHDPQSVTLLEAWLDRNHGDEWRQPHTDHQGNGSRQPKPDGNMSALEAREILGVSADADREQIIHAHRHLMQKLHPDRGGSDYFATKLNQAKKVLLNAPDVQS